MANALRHGRPAAPRSQQISGQVGTEGPDPPPEGRRKRVLAAWLGYEHRTHLSDKHKIRMFAAREDRPIEVPVILGYTRHETGALESVAGLVAHREGNLNS